MTRKVDKNAEEAQIEQAQEQFDLDFKDPELLRVALTHKSFAHEEESGDYEINEKLEFLGDSVLNFIITDYIFKIFDEFNEGDLAKLRATLVNTEILAKKAHEIKIGDFILLGKGAEQTGGRERTSILADCFEAVVGAIYLDKGLDHARGFVLSLFEETVKDRAQMSDLSDCKTSLQELSAQLFSVLPEYKIYKEEGPVHERMFYAQVMVKKNVLGKGKGKSKKKAEQQAAKEALKQINQNYCQGVD